MFELQEQLFFLGYMPNIRVNSEAFRIISRELPAAGL